MVSRNPWVTTFGHFSISLLPKYWATRALVYDRTPMNKDIQKKEATPPPSDAAMWVGLTRDMKKRSVKIMTANAPWEMTMGYASVSSSRVVDVLALSVWSVTGRF